MGDILGRPPLTGKTERVNSLIEAARRGERDAEEEIAQLIRSYSRHVCRSGASSNMPDLDWEDVAQEASRRFFAVGITQFRPGGPVRSYLYSIVRTTFLELVRRTWRRQQREEQAAITPPPPDNPETQTLLHSILSRLPELCRELLQRLYFDGATYAELSLELNLAESSVRARSSRCLGKARDFVSRTH